MSKGSFTRNAHKFAKRKSMSRSRSHRPYLRGAIMFATSASLLVATSVTSGALTREGTRTSTVPTVPTTTYAYGLGSPFQQTVVGADIWVTDQAFNRVDEVNASTGAVVAAVNVAAAPGYLVYADNLLWVTSTNQHSSELFVINPATATVVKQIAVASQGRELVVGNDLWVTDDGATGTVTEVSLSTQSVVRVIPDELSASNQSGPLNMVSVGSDLWVTNNNTNTVTEIDETTGTVLNVVAVGSGADSIVVDGGKLYVGCDNDNNVYVINPGSATVLTTITVGANNALSVQDGQLIAAASNTSDHIDVLAPATESILVSIPAAVTEANVVYGDGFLWAASAETSTVSKINLSSHKVVGTSTIAEDSDMTSIGVAGNNVFVALTNTADLAMIVASTGKTSLVCGTYDQGEIATDGTNLFLRGTQGRIDEYNTVTHATAQIAKYLGADYALAYANGDLFYQSMGSLNVYSVAQAKVIKSIPISNEAFHLDVVGNTLWGSLSDTGQLIKVNLSTLALSTITLPTGSSPWTITSGGADVWVVGSNAIYEVNPTTNAFTAIPVAGRPEGALFVNGHLWVDVTVTQHPAIVGTIHPHGPSGSGELLRVAVPSGTVEQTISIPPQPTSLVFDGTALWIGSQENGVLTAVNPATGTIVGQSAGFNGGATYSQLLGTTLYFDGPGLSPLTTVGLSGVLGSVYFANGVSTVPATSSTANSLKAVAKAIVSGTYFAVTVDGYADSSGTPAQNKQVSQARANAAAAALSKDLKALGATHITVTAVGQGVSTSSKNPALDRRADITALR